MVLEPCSEASRFSDILFSKLAFSGSWSSLGLFGLLKAPSAGALLGLSWPPWGSLGLWDHIWTLES